MQSWIEATGDYQWILRLNRKIGLNVPVSTRYENMLDKIKENDIIFHHITTQRAEKPSHQGSIVGISKVASEVHKNGKKLVVDIKDVVELPIPIKFSEYTKIKNPSKKFDYLLHINLQRYITEIEKDDVKQIIELNKKNLLLLRQHPNYRNILG